MIRSFLGFVLLIAVLTQCYSQKDTVYSIEEVIIRDKKISSLNPENNRPVFILEKKDILELPVTNLNDLLEYLSNTDIRKRGADDVQADISIRGGSFEQNLILLNGIRINNPQTGHHNLNIPIDLSQIERIEIMEGASARLLGNGAFSGVINIITETNHKNFVKLQSNAGMYGLYGGGISANFHKPLTTHFVAVSGKKCDGYTKNTDFYNLRMFYHGQIRINKSSLGMQIGVADKGFGANSFYSARYPDQYEETKTGFGSLNFSSGKKNIFSANAYWHIHHDRFELFRESPPQWYLSHNFHLTDVAGTSAKLQLANPLGMTTLRTEFYTENIRSNVLGKKTNDTLDDIFDKEGFFTRKDSRNNFSISADQTLKTHKTTFSFGLLAYYNNRFGFDMCPGMDVNIRLNKLIDVFISANKSFRIPSYTDMFYKGPVNRANPDILPEKAYTVESGINIRTGIIQYWIKGFLRYGKNIIDWVKEPDSTIWKSANITQVLTYGTEIQFNINFTELKYKKNPVQHINISYAYINSTKNSGEMISYYVMDYLKHKFLTNINLKIYKSLGLNLLLNISDRNGTYTEFSSGQEKEYKPFFVTDAKLFWRPKNFDIFLTCNNVFNVKYYDFGNIRMPGTWLSGGISYTFDINKKSP